MRLCIVYDCLYPYTIGGAERWYRGMADELVRAGHEVTYLTRRQWAPGTAPEVPGVRVVVVSGEDPLYDAEGRRRIAPPLRFGLGVLRHLARNRGRYDAVHSCAFPFFSLLAARAALAGTRVRVGVDWFEVWTRAYWQAYLGAVGGRTGHLVQRACVRLTDQAFVFSELHRRRLRDEGLRSDPIRLAGLYAGPLQPPAGVSPGALREPLVVFAGRHIPEKRAELVPAAVAEARTRIPGLRGVILGDGPRRDAVRAAIAEAGAEDFVSAPGFVPAADVAAAMAGASCHVLPSSREGYGLVVIEAAAYGTPSVVVAGEDNAAAELVERGVNGLVVDSPAGLADAIVAVHEDGAALRERTASWFLAAAPRLTAAASVQRILQTLNEEPATA